MCLDNTPNVLTDPSTVDNTSFRHHSLLGSYTSCFTEELRYQSNLFLFSSFLLSLLDSSISLGMGVGGDDRWFHSIWTGVPTFKAFPFLSDLCTCMFVIMNCKIIIIQYIVNHGSHLKVN